MVAISAFSGLVSSGRSTFPAAALQKAIVCLTSRMRSSVICRLSRSTRRTRAQNMHLKTPKRRNPSKM